MKNQLTDLNNHLFAQLERLSDEGLSGDQLAEEIQRSDAITKVAGKVIDNGTLVLNASKAVGEGMIRKPIPLLEDKS